MDEMRKVEREIAEKLAVMLLSGFHWNKTKEGEQYWHDVYKALQRIAIITIHPLIIHVIDLP